MAIDVANFLVGDALVAAGVLVAAIVFVFTLGKHSVVAIFSALGLAAAFSALAPVVGRVPMVSAWPNYQQHILVFGLVFVLTYFIFRRHIFFAPSVTPSSLEGIVFGSIIGGFILAVIGSFLPADIIATLTPTVKLIFVDDIGRSLWLASPLIGFVLMKGE